MYGFDPTQQVISQSYKGYDLIGSLKPLWAIDLDNEEDIINWMGEVIPALMNNDADRHSVIFKNRNFYMGLQSFNYGAKARSSTFGNYDNNYRGALSRIFANQVYDLVEQKVSKMTRFPANIDVMPANSEFQDRMAARMSKMFVDHLFYINDMDTHVEHMARYARTDGESFLFIEWDKDKGDLMPGAAKAFKNSKRVPLVDKHGNPIIGESGEPLYIDKPPMTGDVSYRLVQSHNVLLDPQDFYGDCQYVIEISRKNIDELRADFPGIALDINEDGQGSYSDGLYSANLERPGDVVVYDIYHKHSKYLGKGRHIKATANTILINEDLPYSHGELPCVRLADIQAPGELRGISFLQNVLLLQVMYNQLLALMYRNIALGAHLYWMIPRGANVNANAIRNSESAITYSGGVPPTIQTFRTVGAEVFNLLSIVGQELQKVARIHGISRGDIPARAESGVFLAALEEQENQAHNAEIKHQNAAIKKIARLSLATAGDYYTKEDGRTLRIVGKDMEYEVQSLDVAKLAGPYEIRIRRSTALSESPATRLAQIQTIAQTFPDMFPREQVMDMLDLANEQKFYDLTTQAVRAAEREVELMNEGIEVEPPERFEAILVHWDVHARNMQTRAFKEAPEDVKQLHLDHMLLTEALIYEKAFIEGNPALQQRLIALENFPMVFVMPQQGVGPGPEAGAQGEAAAIPSGAADPLAPEPTEMSGATPPIPGETPQPPVPPPTERPEPTRVL